jgi:8-oxo-dGTP pyrophosphatase MutT (NUDIX family)
MAKSYITEQTEEGIPLVRTSVEGRKVEFAPGLSAADPRNPNRPRERESFLNYFLAPMIECGAIGDGVKSRWDDRKFRFSSASLQGEVLEIKLGITHYNECFDCRSINADERTRLFAKGRKMKNPDPYAFFTRGCGIEVTPITADGSIFLGRRKTQEEASGYSGELAAVNGWVNYRGDLGAVNFEEDVLRELMEELGIREKDISRLSFAGVYSSPLESDTDFAYLAQTKLPDTFFSSGQYKGRRKDEEHGELVRVKSFRDMRQLLETGGVEGCEGRFNVLYSLRASLEQIKPDEMA